ncbi:MULTISPECIES: LysR substrate-binding domain-containing protein [Roseobacteraceae]|uniref:LysR family transcriptional regulator n=1 Tax=Ponticoccus alexandrii TaxID=1943633 RepID=A0ABX7F786_9RHOB|nr:MULTISPECIES: LysR substrate-binding domain-containing protein [Roseobacteraceae]ETA52500.1 LysR family transcriptional regulator [Rhodobacteraceae bacterium PD-2]QKS10814.1 LysR family transcriptional regulator [Pseudosulfitobacter pseudonitzschiae]QRF65454.1 LysR family transcriptional regulator [Ponticoccus alexandrii]
MIDLRKMEQFVAVAEECHFHRAAQRLGMSQPPLTVAIRRLEEDLGVDLIERGGNRMLGLTAAGQAFLHEARETLRQAGHAIATARETAAGRTGLIRLGYVGSALYGRLPDTIRTFRRARPNVRLELHEATTAAQIAGLRDGTLDAGIVIPPIAGAAGIELHDFDQDRLCIALSLGHHLAGKDDLCVADIADEDFVLWPMVEGRGFHLQVIRLCTDAGFVPRVTQEAHGMHAVLSLVAVGAGVSVVPESMRQFRPDQITYRPIAEAGADFPLCLALHKPGPATVAFKEIAFRGDSI